MAKKRRRRSKKPRGPGPAATPPAEKPSPRRRSARRAGRSNPPRWLGIGVALLVVAGTLLFTLRPEGAPRVSAERLAEQAAQGAESPLVTIVEYGDFGCPSCRAWHNAGIARQILAEYGDVVRMEWRDFPVITPLSPRAAEAAQCAQDQGRFWEYHDRLYESGQIDPASLKRSAAELGLDGVAFDACLDSGQHRATVQADLNEGRALRLRGTPSFIVNGQLLTGPPSYDVLRQLIEESLAGDGR